MTSNVILFKGLDGYDMYKMWYNEQRGRVFTKNHSNYSFDDCFQIVHKYIVSDPSFQRWCMKYQKGVISYVPGNVGAVTLPVTYILNNYIKSLMGLPFYRYGGFSDWVSHPSDVIKEIGDFTLLPKYERYILVRKLMIEALLPVFSTVPFRDTLINALITVYHSETGMQVFLHNGFPNFGKGFYSDSDLKRIGKPNSTAFGLGQWLGSRLIDYYYFVAENLAAMTDPRKIGPEILYHPSFQIAFMAFELRRGGAYHKTILKTLNKWKNSGVTPSYKMMVELILTKYQGIEKNDPQFQSQSKISDEKKTIDKLPAEFRSAHSLTKLM